MTYTVTIPKLNENDDEIVVTELFVTEGNYIHVQNRLLSVETSKSIQEIDAPISGYVNWHVHVGDIVPIFAKVATIFSDQRDYSESKEKSRIHLGTDSKSRVGSTPRHNRDVTATQPARRLAESHGIDISSISSKGIISERDIIKHLENSQLASKQSNVISPKTGRINQKFYHQLVESPQDIAALESDEKIELYRQHGANIDDNVTIGIGTILQAEFISIGAYTDVEEAVLVNCRQFSIGSLGRIGKHSKFICRDFVAGDVVTIRWNVAVVDGQGGIGDCQIGDLSLIAYDAYINTDRSVRLGERVCIGPGVRIYTHRKWLEYTDGYPCDYSPVTIDDRSWLGPNSVVQPGVDLGKEVTVMPNSVVVNNGPNNVLLGGVPATVIKRKQSQRLTRDEIKSRTLELLENNTQILLKGGWTFERSFNSLYAWSCHIIKENMRCAIVFTEVPTSADENNDQRIIYLVYTDEPVQGLRENTTLFNLKNKTVNGVRDDASDTIRHILTKYGIYFEPRLWRRNVAINDTKY